MTAKSPSRILLDQPRKLVTGIRVIGFGGVARWPSGVVPVHTVYESPVPPSSSSLIGWPIIPMVSVIQSGAIGVPSRSMYGPMSVLNRDDGEAMCALRQALQ